MTESPPSEKQIINKSTVVVIGPLMVVIALFGWVCLATLIRIRSSLGSIQSQLPSMKWVAAMKTEV